ncbi:F0F1 ATP synthase subunit delta [Actinomycetospora sp. NBRC 106378]|uniref:F0F1 ATP synthase subunit delta n=1 Tax=Actinomycetospora sp. NBRC 106378 TaxID=3032208 RepID=UPI0024A13B86|nr:F0F1 ATP synthase subunit delta [Actinomycetospora sp. NBRC 106378]GLZ54722.1 ATP synthase subunit delta [Actinomycetospora sp. NBRC 106378]
MTAATGTAGVIADFRATSRDSLQGVRRRFDEITGNASSADLVTVGEQLDAVADLLDREAVLRRTLADASTDPQAREGLAGRVFDNQVEGSVADVVKAAAKASWSKPADLVQALRVVARESLLAAAEADGRLDAVEDELFRLGRIVGGQPDLERLLGSPSADAQGKQKVLDDLLENKAEPITRRLAAQLVAHPLTHHVSTGLERLAELAADRRQRSVATVRSAVELSDEQQERLAGVLARIYGREITVHLEVDPDLLGGLVIQVGDEVIDGSAAGHLDDLNRRLG